MRIYSWSTADSFNLHNIPKSTMHKPSNIKTFYNNKCTALHSFHLFSHHLSSSVSHHQVFSVQLYGNVLNRSRSVIFMSSLLFCGPGGIAGHVEQHCAQVWHHTQRTGSAEQAVLQSSGAWPGVNRRARLHWYIQLHHFITVPQQPHIYSISPRGRSLNSCFWQFIMHCQWFAFISQSRGSLDGGFFGGICMRLSLVLAQSSLLTHCSHLYLSVTPLNCLLITVSVAPLGCN